MKNITDQMRLIIKSFYYLLFYFLRNFLNIFYKFREVSILDYHSIDNDDWELSISSEVFEKQINYLKNKKYYFASLDEITSYIKRERDLPKKTVAITFDDGYEDFYINAYPILIKYNIPATVFVFSNSFTEKSFLKNNTNILTISQMNEIKDSGLVSFGHHSATHKMLETLSSNDLEKELENSADYDYFAYPGGHYSKEVIEAVKRNGFRSAFSIKPGLITRDSDLFLIKRNVILKDMNFWEFKLRVTKAIDWYVSLARKFKKYE